MKNAIKYLLHKLLGFKNYLFLFSLYKIRTLKSDRNERDFFKFMELIPAGTSVLDIGANIGIMTVHLARSEKNLRVFSFEPMPTNIEAFNRIIRHFCLKNVHLFEVALGNKEGEAEMVMPVISNVRMQGLSHVVHDSIPENNAGEYFKVPLKKLDSMPELMNSSQRISAIKIDVENFEFFVLDGARELIKKNKPVVYAELWENENRESCFRLFKEFEYRTYVILEGSRVEYDSRKHVTQNFIFLPQ
ncbi:MAG: FkbM family methyltransferase [Bacteroidota bacterium]|nr:FkbM family methyltransferase [Bacteroidota bacterium]